MGPRFLIYFLFFFIGYQCWSQKPNLRFTHITSLEGLSNSHIKTIVQDKQGFMWFGSENGLNRYDAYTITVYKHRSKDSTSIIHNDIIKLHVDSEGNLWVATLGGLDMHQPASNDFLHFPEVGPLWKEIFEDSDKNLWVGSDTQLFLYEKEKKSFRKIKHHKLSSNISSIYEDKRGNLWVCTASEVFLFDQKGEQLISQPHINLKGVKSILEDSEGKLWFGASNGLNLYDRDEKTLSLYPEINSNSSAVISIIEDSFGKLWVGTQNQGLRIFEKGRKKYYEYQSVEGDPESLGFNTVNVIFNDKNNNIWLGTYSGGVNLVTKNTFLHYKTNPLIKNALSNNHVLNFFQDSQGKIWIGTDGGGLNIFNKNEGTFEHLRVDPKRANGLKSDVITSFMEDSRGNIWIGYWAAGLDLYDRAKNKFIHFNPDENNKTGILTPNCVMNIYEDTLNNRFWVGTLNGLYEMDREKGEFKQHSIGSQWEERVADILADREGNLWIGTWEGLNLIDKESNEIIRFLHDSKKPGTLSNDQAFVLYEDSKGRLWIGTGNGLNLYNKETRSFKAYTEDSGLPSNVIYGILEDHENNLWISTSNGLSKFNPSTGSFKNFNVKDGLQGNEFKRRSFYKLKTGEMLFGGSNGFNLFNPSEIKDNPVIPEIVLTDFKIFNSSVIPGEKNSPLKRNISQTSEITLSYKHSVFSFDFAALNYILPEKNKYAYKLEGFDNNWNNIGRSRTATFTNIDPGEYFLRIKASNNDGIWNDSGITVKITITPPFWETWWFRIIVLYAIVAAAVAWYKIRTNSLKNQRKELEKQVKERTLQLLEANNSLLTQKEEIESQREHIQEIYNEMKDSIVAAEQIQKSILPSESFIKKYLPESFILNKPKAVVSGDFYWFDVVNNKIIIAALDCTGHGVSGAFMSILAFNHLNQCIYGTDTLAPAIILDKINEGLIKDLHNKNETSNSRDGMDISLCVIDKENYTLEFSGANHPLYILRNQQLINIKPDRFPIGFSYKGRTKKYTNHEIKIEKGDTIYLFSDGYADQIGGDNGDEKFMYSRFRDLLLKISRYNAEQQLEMLEKNLHDWKKDREQLDDIMVIGFKIS